MMSPGIQEQRAPRRGWTVRSFLATMYELGFDLQAVPGTLARELAGLYLFRTDRLMIHTAHEHKTASEHYCSLKKGAVPGKGETPHNPLPEPSGSIRES